MAGMILAAMNDLPGIYKLGEVFGLAVRSRCIGSRVGAFAEVAGRGELKGMARLSQ